MERAQDSYCLISKNFVAVFLLTTYCISSRLFWDRYNKTEIMDSDDLILDFKDFETFLCHGILDIQSLWEIIIFIFYIYAAIFIALYAEVVLRILSHTVHEAVNAVGL